MPKVAYKKITDQALVKKAWLKFLGTYYPDVDTNRARYPGTSQRETRTSAFRGHLLKNGLAMQQENGALIFLVLQEESAMLYLMTL